VSSESQLANHSQTSSAEYSAEERKLLLRFAHESIRAGLHGRRFEPPAPSPHLAEERGAFTTLHIAGKLRGCIGYIVAASPLYLTVIETAASAAFEDPRFMPVNEAEEQHVQIEISVLSPLAPILPEKVETGRHGLMISHHGRRGLLLPQVPIEWGWDRERFLSETCRKAGLPPNAWQHGATVEAFTAEVFSELSPGDSLHD
jgi:AmmeMemoRadiSam system protein A